jgi:flagellar assembly factor FliW
VTIAAGPVVIPRTRQSVEEGAMSTENTATSVTMIEPLAGFEAHTEYTLTRTDDAGMLQSLRSVRDTELRFVISPAEVFFAAYRDSLTDVIEAPVAGALGVARSEADLAMYVMLTIGASLKDTTANLRAPLVVDRATGRAVQVILEDDSLPLSQPLPPD